MKIERNIFVAICKWIVSIVPCFASIYLNGQSRTGVKNTDIHHWFPSYNFSIDNFRYPSLNFAPFTRWWWPGNSVDTVELKREINLFADHGFGGVEIQPLYRFIPGTKEIRAKETTWDTPEYYSNLISVMNEARKRRITIDMTDGSGWPPGGPYLDDEDGFWTLDHADTIIHGGTHVEIKPPVVKNKTQVPSKLVAVLAARQLPGRDTAITKTISLDTASLVVVTKFLKNNTLFWEAPAGEWIIIACWSKPMGEMAFTATSTQGPVMDHFDSARVLKNYRHLFGERTGLQPYFGNPMRAVFDDSYEFSVDRHFTPYFLEFFKKRRGYDITRWLPSQLQKGYNFVSFSRPVTEPDFRLTTQDWRLRYDYDNTLNDLIGDQFEDATKNWLEPQGLLHRTQAYGFNMDMIGLAGRASIPETESMNGTEMNLKISTSGGHLYNKPIITAESVVFQNRAYTNSPQKIKLAVDKLFAAGVNQIIYHGVPYRYTPPELGAEGWYPFSRPNSVNSYSANLGEGNIFWKDQKEVNEYVARVQYAMRSGKSKSEVLIYFPFTNMEGIPANPKEILATGELPGIEGPLPQNTESKSKAKEKWAEVVYPLINELEANGITWDWVNDLSIEEAKITATKQIDIRGNLYQSLILAEDTMMPMKTALGLKALAVAGINLLAVGRLPTIQPSYLNWEKNDNITAQAIQEVLKQKNSKYIKKPKDVSSWFGTIGLSIKFQDEYDFTRTAERIMTDGSRLKFIWNKSDQWQKIRLSLAPVFKTSFWLNADGGIITKNNGLLVSYNLPPYGSILLYASVKGLGQKGNSIEPGLNGANIFKTIGQWNIKTDSVEVFNQPLFDLRSNDAFKYVSAPVVYNAIVQCDTINPGANYFLDLGKVYYTGEVLINNQNVGKRIFAPYEFNISSFLKKGTNIVTVRVTPSQLNGFILKANQGDARYRQFRNKENQLMSGGLLGPAVIYERIKNELLSVKPKKIKISI